MIHCNTISIKDHQQLNLNKCHLKQILRSILYYIFLIHIEINFKFKYYGNYIIKYNKKTINLPKFLNNCKNNSHLCELAVIDRNLKYSVRK